MHISLGHFKKGLFLFCLLFTIAATAQIQDPVKWTSEVEKVSENEYDLIFEASI